MSTVGRRVPSGKRFDIRAICAAPRVGPIQRAKSLASNCHVTGRMLKLLYLFPATKIRSSRFFALLVAGAGNLPGHG